MNISEKCPLFAINRIVENDFHTLCVEDVLFSGKSKFQKVFIVKNPIFGKILILDDKIQSAQIDEFIYHEALVHPAMVVHPEPKKVAILGGGEGATLREVLKHPCVKRVDMIELDDLVVDISKKYLQEWCSDSFEDQRTNLIIQDAKKYILELDSGIHYDVIIVDLTDPLDDSPAKFLFTKEFMSVLKKRLSEKGILIYQAASITPFFDNAHIAVNHTASEVFKIVNSYSAHVQSFDETWGFVWASDYFSPFDDLDKIDKILLDRNVETRFYDKETHVHCFSLPKYLRNHLKEKKIILSDSSPLPKKLIRSLI
ncbi:Spermidine synthase [Thermodesulfobium narugense DSM 14796]|uniref:Polyamine aminopropyltransferase n=1 Tax=Thermodesulfobium narugense DSM 14796 TaxID=747365 RepID=M1E954_9BACT|nr:polyamine aminopropyltransferase [Thermodesulfobium narugense]AEE14874.1 Spermidine synthase [Thermodesulfobium narugense DSM 14796]